MQIYWLADVQMLILWFHLQSSRMAFVELNIDPKLHRHIVGRNGANSQSAFVYTNNKLLQYCR